MKRRKKTNQKGTLFIAAVFLTLVLLVGGIIYLQVRVIRKDSSAYAMGAQVTVTVYGKNSSALEARSSAAIGAVHALDSQISCFLPHSEVEQINAHKGAVSAPETAYILKTILPLCQATEGRYDPTLGSILELWDFESSPKTIPDQRQIALALCDVGYQHLEVDGDFVTLNSPLARLNLGSVGKGYACDKAVSALEGGDVTAGVVSVGGSIGLFGKKPDSKLFRIDVTDPKDSANRLGSLHLSGGNFISTSGAYERYILYNGVTYGHILDATTGFPANSSMLSCTVVSSSGLMSDALSTACFLLEPKEALFLLNQSKAEGVLVDQTGTVYVTDGLRNAFSLSAQGYRFSEEESSKRS